MSRLRFHGRRVLWGEPKGIPVSFSAEGHCCPVMADALTNDCDQHENPFDCPDMLLSYSPVFREYGLIVHDGGASSVLINYCPFCGAALPNSLRDEWFETLEEMGVENPLWEPETVPEAFATDAWWKSRKKES